VEAVALREEPTELAIEGETKLKGVRDTSGDAEGCLAATYQGQGHKSPTEPGVHAVYSHAEQVF
jgi:hypothetical protein